MKISSIVWIHFAALIAAAGVVIHVGALFGGPSWFAFFGAPPSVVASARNGTWLAHVSGGAIAGLMGMCAWYAESAVGLVKRPPFQRLGLGVIASVCLVRALLLPVLAVSHPQLRNNFEIVAAIVWFLAGVGFSVGFFMSVFNPAVHRTLRDKAAQRR